MEVNTGQRTTKYDIRTLSMYFTCFGMNLAVSFLGPMPTKTDFSSLVLSWSPGLIAAAACCFVVTLAFAAKPVPAPTKIDVTTIVHDEHTAVPPNQLLLRSDDYNGVFQASYKDPASYGSNMSLTFSGWNLSLFNQSLRTIWLTLSRPVALSPPAPAPDGYYSAKVEMYSRCYDSNNQRLSASNLTMTPGTSLSRCDLGVDFAYGRDKYVLVMGPQYPGTGWATVTCNTADSAGACNNWTISPNMAGGFGNVPTVANLSLFGPHGLIVIGQYYNTYRIDVTNP